jgi:hypothetical protein
LPFGQCVILASVRFLTLQHLHKLRAEEQRDPKVDKNTIKGMTIALPKDRIGKLLPSYNKENGTVTLDDLMALVEKHMKGTEFHAEGDPTLKRLAFLKRVEKLKKHIGMDGHNQKKRGPK